MEMDLAAPSKAAEKVTRMLNKLLADEYIMLAKTRNYHWQLFGPSLVDMHRFYEGQYERLRDMFNELAERVAQLGHPANATLREFLQWTRLKGSDLFNAPRHQVEQLLDDHETLCRQIRTDISMIEGKLKADDPVTVSMLGNILNAHEKMSWTLRSYLGFHGECNQG